MTPYYKCPRCKRPTSGWPLQRADVCSPKVWAHCIREPQPDWEVIEEGLGPIPEDAEKLLAVLREPSE